jgi:hypothetical protein
VSLVSLVSLVSESSRITVESVVSEQSEAGARQKSLAKLAKVESCMIHVHVLQLHDVSFFAAMSTAEAAAAAPSRRTAIAKAPPGTPPAAPVPANLLTSLDLHPSLRQRINEVYPPAAAAPCSPSPSKWNAVLYLPTVLLRIEHNPAFALACRVANALGVPVVVLAVVPDDAATPAHRSNVPPAHDNVVGGTGTGTSIAMTARRLAFHLEALSAAAQAWSDHGAGTAVRLHGPRCRSPDHLTLAGRARFVVTDEPFVDPYLGLVQRVERAARAAGVRCVRVDGSTTVPPRAVLRRLSRRRGAGGSAGSAGGSAGSAGGGAALDDDDPTAPLLWEGVPSKAWMWQKKTEGQRMGHVRAAVVEGAFDPPELSVKIARDRFFGEEEEEEEEEQEEDGPCRDGKGSGNGNGSACPSADPAFLAALPPAWRNPTASAPGTRPWSASDLASVANLKDFAAAWPGADAAVPPCPQTTGTARAGVARWNAWIRDRAGLRDYGRSRNDMRRPHAPSRMSCYLNLGVVSVFRLVHEVKAAQARGCAGADKYEEEIVKWREMAYAFCFSRADYCGAGSVPSWAQQWLERQPNGTNVTCGRDGALLAPSLFGWHSLATGQTGNDKWDAMQRYLVSTGELHNNVRMTWGKTVVGWASRMPRAEGISVTASVLQTLCFLNDRYALDGLSPPSYAGLLWCLGWCDKPGKGGGISPKPASNYRYSPEDFRLAERALLAGPSGSNSASTISSGGGASTSSMKHSASQSSILDMLKKQHPKSKKQRTDEDGVGTDSSAVKEPLRSASKTSPGINGVVKKGSIASFFSPKSK